ncbi:MAG: hypothetical protein ACI9YU_000032 [Flavobacteriales bacterium]
MLKERLDISSVIYILLTVGFFALLWNASESIETVISCCAYGILTIAVVSSKPSKRFNILKLPGKALNVLMNKWLTLPNDVLINMWLSRYKTNQFRIAFELYSVLNETRFWGYCPILYSRFEYSPVTNKLNQMNSFKVT